MKLLRLISFPVLLLVFTIASAQEKQPNKSDGSAAEKGAQPQLFIESTTHDFGEMKAGMPLRYAFKIKNTGKADLVIESVKPG